MTSLIRKPRDPKVLEQWTNDILHKGIGITDWERDFASSIKQYLARGTILSFLQEDTLEKIYAEKTP